MKKFKFQLETLLKVTRMNKDKAEVELAKATQNLEEQRQLLKQRALLKQRQFLKQRRR